jgi:hypothetical protein
MINNPSENVDLELRISYAIAPGPFDYTELRYHTPLAIAYEMWAGSDPYEWNVYLDDEGNDYISQSGVYDSRKPIPQDTPNPELGASASLWIIYDDVPHILDAIVIGG